MKIKRRAALGLGLALGLAGLSVPAMAKSDITVTLENHYDGNQETADIQALDASGNVLWSKKMEPKEAMQLPHYTGLSVCGERYYYVSDGEVVVLNAVTGEELFRNPNFKGSPAAEAYAFDAEGNLYLSGYLGPDLFIMDASGKERLRRDSIDSSYYWPYILEYGGDGILYMTFENVPDTANSTQLAVNASSAVGTPAKYDQEADYEWEKAVSMGGQSQQTPAAPSTQITFTTDLAGAFLDINATSCLSEYGMTHWGRLMLDNDPATAWVEGVSGNGEGQGFTMSYKQTVQVTGFAIMGGYQKNSDIFYKNSRPSRISISASDGTKETFDLADGFGEQCFTLSKPFYTDLVTVTIDSVYPGNKYQDTCISGFRLY